MRQKGFAPLIVLLIIIFIVGVSYFAYSKGYVNFTAKPVLIPNQTVSPVITPSPVSSGNTQSVDGAVTGKLCYPSSFIPKGSIEAKSITTSKIYTQDYLGTANGRGSSYTIDLPADKYQLRFKASQGESLGYHTTVCPTGIETTCGDSEQRILISAEVVSNQTSKGYDLCDFYYSPQNAPEF